MPGARITVKVDSDQMKLVAAKGLLLTLTDPGADESHRSRAARTARAIVDINEAASELDVARMLARFIEEAPLDASSKLGAVNQPAKPKGRKGKPAGAPKPKDPAQPDSGFEGQHPRGRGGMWIKKGAGTGPGAQPNQNVTQLQRRLAQLGYGPGAPDGKYGDLTQAALRKFQTDYGLQGDGSQLDPATLQVLQNPPPQKLAEIQAQNRAIAAMPNAQGVAPKAPGATGGGPAATATSGATAKAASTPAPSTTGTGAQQQQTTTSLDTANPEAVRTFQQTHGLTVDGVAGPNTLAMMKGLGVSQTNANGTTTTTAPSTGSTSTKKTSTGSAKKTSGLALGAGVAGRSNPGVKTVQDALAQLGFDPGGSDGRFGPDTKKAVQRLQRKYGLKADGIVGPQTKNLLNRLAKRAAKKAASPKVKSADELAMLQAERVERDEERLIEARDERVRAERAGDVDAFVEARARELAMRESLLNRPNFDPSKHPRDRRGRFLDFRAGDRLQDHQGDRWSVLQTKPDGTVMARSEDGARTRSFSNDDAKKMSFAFEEVPAPIERMFFKMRHHKVQQAQDSGGEASELTVQEAHLNRPVTVRQPHRFTPIFDESKTHMGDFAPAVHPRNRVGEFSAKGGPKKKRRRLVPWSTDKPFPHYVEEFEETIMDHLPVRLIEAAARRERATPGTTEHTEARAREVEIARQMMEGKAIGMAERKASATVVRKKGDKTEYKFPIPDKNHAKAALAYIDRGDLTPEEKAKVRAKAKGKLKEAQVEEEIIACIEADDIVMVEMLVGELMLEAGIDSIEEAADSLVKASTPEPFSSSKTSNWVARSGGLPAYIQHIAHDLVEKRGKSVSNAIQMAIGIVKRWAKGGGNVDDKTRAAAAKAVAEWEALKAKNKAKSVAEASWREILHPRDRGGQFRDGLGRMDERSGKWRGSSDRTFASNTKAARGYAAKRNAMPESATERAARMQDESFQRNLNRPSSAADARSIAHQVSMGPSYGPDTSTAKRSLLKGLETAPDSALDKLDDRDAITLHTETKAGEDYADFSGLHARLRKTLDKRTSTYARGYVGGLAVYEAVWNGHLHPRDRNGKFTDAAYNPSRKTERLPGKMGRGLTGERGDGLQRMFPDNIPSWQASPTRNPGSTPARVLTGQQTSGRTDSPPTPRTSGPDSLPGSFDSKPTGVNQEIRGLRQEYVDHMKAGRPAEAHRTLAKHDRILLAQRSGTKVTDALGGRDNLTPDPVDYSDPTQTVKMSMSELAKAAHDDMMAQKGSISPRLRTYLEGMTASMSGTRPRQVAMIDAFLSNAGGWTGKNASGIKRELRRRAKAITG